MIFPSFDHPFSSLSHLCLDRRPSSSSGPQAVSCLLGNHTELSHLKGATTMSKCSGGCVLRGTARSQGSRAA